MKVSDEQLVAALLHSTTDKQAAETVGLSVSQFRNRIAAPAFKLMLTEAKKQLLNHAVALAESRLTAAVGVIVQVMQDANTAAGTRVAAADALIRNTLKLIELNDVSRRLDELERLVADAEKER